MAMFGKLIKLARSPQGQKLLSQAQEAARDPKNRERLQDVRSRLGNTKRAPAQDAQATDVQKGRDAAPEGAGESREHGASSTGDTAR